MTGLGIFILWTLVGTFAAFCLFILVLLARVMLRRNARSYPTPSASPRQTRHELVWTITPLILVAVVAVQSLRLLYFENTNPAADLSPGNGSSTAIADRRPPTPTHPWGW